MDKIDCAPSSVQSPRIDRERRATSDGVGPRERNRGRAASAADGQGAGLAGCASDAAARCVRAREKWVGSLSVKRRDKKQYCNDYR